MVLSVFFSIVFLVFFLPVLISHTTSSIAAVLTIVSLVIFSTGTTGVLNFALALLCLHAFVIGFLTDRKYIYTLAIIFLMFCPFLLVAKLGKIAEFSAVLCYLSLVLGILKDTSYDKIVEN